MMLVTEGMRVVGAEEGCDCECVVDLDDEDGCCWTVEVEVADEVAGTAEVVVGSAVLVITTVDLMVVFQVTGSSLLVAIEVAVAVPGAVPVAVPAVPPSILSASLSSQHPILITSAYSHGTA